MFSHSGRCIAFQLDCVPPRSTAQGKRLRAVGGNAVFFKDKKHESNRELLTGLLKPYQPEKPIEGPTLLWVEVVWPYLNQHTATKAKQGRTDLIEHTSKPDLDNWVKELQDLLVSLRFLASDQQVSALLVRKFWGPTPGISVAIYEGVRMGGEMNPLAGAA